VSCQEVTHLSQMRMSHLVGRHLVVRILVWVDPLAVAHSESAVTGVSEMTYSDFQSLG